MLFLPFVACLHVKYFLYTTLFNVMPTCFMLAIPWKCKHYDLKQSNVKNIIKTSNLCRFYARFHGSEDAKIYIYIQ